MVGDARHHVVNWESAPGRAILLYGPLGDGGVYLGHEADGLVDGDDDLLLVCVPTTRCGTGRRRRRRCCRGQEAWLFHTRC